MIYNLDLFGKKLKEKRKELNLTQKELSELSLIDIVTIRRIEKGKVIPKLETLELLSPILKKDLISLLLKYRLDDYLVFYEIRNRIELKLDSGEFYNLPNEFRELNILLSSTKNLYYKDLINQLILLTEAIVLYKNNNNSKALIKLIKAIKITTYNFTLNNYNTFVYSSEEIRILMNIAFVLNKLNHKTNYLSIMEFCIDSVDFNDELYPKICHNLASAYMRNNKFLKALEYFNLGIKSCQENRNLNGLNLLYYGKGISEYKLNKELYIDSLKTAIYLCKALKQEELQNTIINNCKEIFGIYLENINCSV